MRCSLDASALQVITMVVVEMGRDFLFYELGDHLGL